jgi:hypothetical protein
MKKKIYLLFLIMAFGFTAFAQANSQELINPEFIIVSTKMNKLYCGIKNEIEISAPGFSSDELIPSINNGLIEADTKSKGKFIVTVSCGSKEAIINLQVKKEGNIKSLRGAYTYRVLNLPDPIAKVGGRESGGVLTKNALLGAGNISAVMKNFEFDIKLQISSYTVTVNIGGQFKSISSTNPNFTSDVIELLTYVKNNGRVIFEDIKVRMPDGTVRLLLPVVIKVNG